MALLKAGLQRTVHFQICMDNNISYASYSYGENNHENFSNNLVAVIQNKSITVEKFQI